MNLKKEEKNIGYMKKTISLCNLGNCTTYKPYKKENDWNI